MTGLKIYAPVFDSSGYAEAARQYVLALHGAGVPVTLSPLEFSKPKPDLGEVADELRELVDRPVDYDAVLVHATPETWRTILRDEPRELRKIGLTTWETTRLHPTWVRACNRMDEVWVPSRWNGEVFSASGVEVPIHVVPHVLSETGAQAAQEVDLPGVRDDDFVFYSVFHWQERKNPEALLECFYSAFQDREPVALVIKTFLRAPDEDPGAIEERIRRVKARVNVMRYATVVPVVQTLSDAGMGWLHQRGDCFALLQRAEGWGLPHFTAAAADNPVLTTGYGGVLDFLEPDAAYLTDFTLRPVVGMDWSPFYRADGRWAEPDLDQAVRWMREIWQDPDSARARGRRAGARVRREFRREVVGRQMSEILQAESTS